MPVLIAFGRALRDLAAPRVLAVLFLPMLAALALWTVLGWIYWETWTGWVRALVDGSALARWLVLNGASWVVSSASALVVFALLIPAILITAMVVTEIVAMPVVLSVAARAYPGLEKLGAGSLVASLGNTAAAFCVFALLWIVTLPLWFTGVGAIALPVLLSAYLNQRLFRFDALSEHAPRAELRTVVSRAKPRLFALGLITALLYYVPFVNLVAPVFTGLAFAHLCLAELTRLRATERLSGG